MSHKPHLPSRRSIRLKGYDYAQAGLYFITICVQDRLFLFGEVHDGVMHLNDAGRMVEQWYAELENKYPDKRCHEMVVMPNHFHCIIENISVVRATPCGRPRTGATIPDAVDWFKTMTTNAYIRGVRDNGWKRFNRKLWQRNYYENIIRTPDAYENISNYIVNNPEKWKDDMFHL